MWNATICFPAWFNYVTSVKFICFDQIIMFFVMLLKVYVAMVTPVTMATYYTCVIKWHGVAQWLRGRASVLQC